jgi:hypothetical protein
VENEMNITIDIHYRALSRGATYGSFQLKGRKPEEVALQYWNEIKKELSYRAELQKIVINGSQDITETVKYLEDQILKSIDNNWNLPF